MPRLLTLLALALLALPAQAQPQSLYTEVVARQPGDLLTVVLVERTTAQRRSTYNDAAATSISAGGALSGGLPGGRPPARDSESGPPHARAALRIHRGSRRSLLDVSGFRGRAATSQPPE